MPIHDFSEEDIRVLREVINEHKKQRANPTNRPATENSWVEGQDFQSNDVYVAQSPAAGIPALSGVTPGEADCNVFRIDTDTGDLEQYENFELKVYNLNLTDIPPDAYVEVSKTKAGNWLASTGVGTGEEVGTSDSTSSSTLVPFEITFVDPECQFVRGFIYDPNDCYESSGTSDADLSITIYDLLDCYFNEPADELLGVRGWATLRSIRTDTYDPADETGTGTFVVVGVDSDVDCINQYVVVHLCCPELI